MPRRRPAPTPLLRHHDPYTGPHNRTAHLSRTLTHRRHRQRLEAARRRPDLPPDWAERLLDDYLSGFSYTELSIKYRIRRDSARRKVFSESLYRLMEQSMVDYVEDLGLHVRVSRKRCPVCHTIHSTSTRNAI